MIVHQLWRFPRDATDLAALRANDTNDRGGGSSSSNPNSFRNFIHGLEKLSNEELGRLRYLIWRYHAHAIGPNQCHSMVVQRICAPVDLVWSVVRQFDNPQAYKHFIKRCSMRGDGRVGSTREVELVSGLPAASSTERLEILDEERHILGFQIVGGEHRLRNYHSVTTLHVLELDGNPYTMVIESYVVDVPDGNTMEDTRAFVDTIVGYNLTSLARIAELQASCKQEELQGSLM
ncbi:hypothetical protein GOP47_0010234 [Adiantum capillus-veneris]|uniref:Uncharacterized protein n=1 Tax=Adiantum capillus-veneris TaxID=13818 RepID=A0A9D4ZG47_ADICA|nr:hypothetical protein GOP47_0010234 [Adiantum capillus-veneris]